MQDRNLSDIETALELARHGSKASLSHSIPIKAIPESGLDFHGGLIDAPIHGRTDKIRLNIPSGSYVLPADIVSAVGQGNTMAGAHAIKEIANDAPYHADSAPYGASALPITHGAGVKGAGGPPAPPPALNPDWTTVKTTSPAMAAGGRATIKAAGVLILTRQKPHKVLFIRRSEGDHKGEWAFPGGKVEEGETEAQAAKRETDEELGAKIHLHPHPLSHRVADGVDFTTYFATVAEPFKPKLNEEHSAFCWRTPDNAPSPLHPGCHVALAALRGSGGRVNDTKEMVPIIAAGGEFVLLPHEVRYFGNGDLEKGQRGLDKFVVKTRRDLRTTLGKLKPPKVD